FIAILGSEAGNLALKVLATGGIYLGGGIPPRLRAPLEDPAFLEAFRHKGRFRELLTQMPVHIILNPKTALLGAASYGLTLWGAARGFSSPSESPFPPPWGCGGGKAAPTVNSFGGCVASASRSQRSHQKERVSWRDAVPPNLPPR